MRRGGGGRESETGRGYAAAWGKGEPLGERCSGLGDVYFSTLEGKMLDLSALCESLGLVDGMEGGRGAMMVAGAGMG